MGAGAQAELPGVKAPTLTPTIPDQDDEDDQDVGGDRMQAWSPDTRGMV